MPKLAVGDEVTMRVTGKVVEVSKASYGDEPRPFSIRLENVAVKVHGEMSDDEIMAMTDVDLNEEMKTRHGSMP